MRVFSTEALLARLAGSVVGFDDACVVVDAHLQVFGSQCGIVQLLQEIRHTCQVVNLRIQSFMFIFIFKFYTLTRVKEIILYTLEHNKLTARHHPAHTVSGKDSLRVVTVGQQIVKTIL